jgi:hypothetical protein
MGIEARTRASGVAVGMVGIGVSLRVVSVAWQMRWVLCPVFVGPVALRGGERSENHASQRVCCLREEEWKAAKSNFKSSAVHCVLFRLSRSPQPCFSWAPWYTLTLTDHCQPLCQQGAPVPVRPCIARRFVRRMGVCLDVHTNSFFPLYLTLYVAQLILLPIITKDKWVCLLIGNTLYLAG